MKVLVTGGSGFLGLELVRALLAAGHQPTSFQRRQSAQLDQLGVEQHLGDLCDHGALVLALQGCEAVLHNAAKTGVWGRRADFLRINHQGTKTLLAAMRATGHRRLVHTSSPSVCFDGQDHRLARGDLAYAQPARCHYAHSKQLAEREVLAAGRRGEILACVLRPHLILGERDEQLLPRFLARARAGRLRCIGRGDNQVSLSWAPDVARAHVRALELLLPGSALVGRAYFLAQREPVALWPWLGELCRALELPPPRRGPPLLVGRALGAACELAWTLLPLSGEPPLTRFVAEQLARSHSYDVREAEQDLGHADLLPMAEVTRRLIAHWRSRPLPA